MAESLRGAYSADRAAALAGVPKSTVYWWASHDVLEPSLSHKRPKLWTFSDVIGLRIIQWLRHDKDGAEKSSMHQVRAALKGMRSLGATIADDDVDVRVDAKGRIAVRIGTGDWRPVGRSGTMHSMVPGTFDPLIEFRVKSASVGPDLRHPRPHLQIIPGKLGGEPHVEGTRIGSLMVAGLVRESGFDTDTIIRLYPMLTQELVDECLDLENQLSLNLAA